MSFIILEGRWCRTCKALLLKYLLAVSRRETPDDFVHWWMLAECSNISTSYCTLEYWKITNVFFIYTFIKLEQELWNSKTVFSRFPRSIDSRCGETPYYQLEQGSVFCSASWQWWFTSPWYVIQKIIVKPNHVMLR